jgi:polyvinyl alcohol dehydrogenase (cytochrome)
MSIRLWVLLAALLAPLAAQGQPAPAPAIDAARIWSGRCAGCHEAPEASSRAPAREVIAARSASGVVQILTKGLMRPMAEGLKPEEVAALASWLTGKPLTAAAEVADRNPCPRGGARALADPPGRNEWNGWGRDLANTRYQPAPGLKAADAPRLKLKWAFAYPGGVNSPATVTGGRVYVASVSGRVYALDAKTGCVHWRYDEAAGVRSALTIGPLQGPKVAKAGKPAKARLAVFYGDTASVAHAIDAATGQPIWSTRVETHPRSIISGSPVLYRGRLYVPVSSLEEGVGGDKKYGCCTFQGAVAALDAATGRILWKSHTIPTAPKPFKTNAAGVQMYGPAGAAVWQPPTIDPRRGVLYVGTGDSYTDVENLHSDAIIAMDLLTGEHRWSRQFTAKDNFLVGCSGRQGQAPNCPDTFGPDHDFGAPPILRTLKGGKQILMAGQKSGVVWGLDPDDQGKVLWSAKVGFGGALGGIEWGMASAPGALYAAVSDNIAGANGKPGLSALALEDGRILWQAPAPPASCAPGVSRCNNGLSAAVSAIPGAVIAGSLDGHLRVYAADTGEVLWDYDTAAQPYQPVNTDTPAKGGPINGAGPTVAGGTIYLHAGYGGLGLRSGGEGNVLLAFSVDGK